MQFLQALVDEMDRRFPKEELAVIKNFSTIAFPDYGLKELKQLHTRFANCLGSFEEIRLEYNLLSLTDEVFSDDYQSAGLACSGS